MMGNYKLRSDNDWVIRLSDNAQVYSGNTEYIDWLDKGNTPLPADPEPITPYTILRESAYKLEADMLFFQEQRGEVPAGAWAAKVAAIKLRYPKL